MQTDSMETYIQSNEYMHADRIRETCRQSHCQKNRQALLSQRRTTDTSRKKGSYRKEENKREKKKAGTERKTDRQVDQPTVTNDFGHADHSLNKESEVFESVHVSAFLSRHHG